MPVRLPGESDGQGNQSPRSHRRRPPIGPRHSHLGLASPQRAGRPECCHSGGQASHGAADVPTTHSSFEPRGYGPPRGQTVLRTPAAAIASSLAFSATLPCSGKALGSRDQHHRRRGGIDRGNRRECYRTQAGNRGTTGRATPETPLIDCEAGRSER